MLANDNSETQYSILLKLDDEDNNQTSSELQNHYKIVVDLNSDFKLLGGRFQFVKPHKTNHKTNVRTRWFGKTVIEVMSSEFKIPEDILREMIETKTIIINTQKPTTIPLLEYQIRSNDQIVTTDWKNEKPVFYQKEIKVIYHDDDFLVIDKPASIPVHPAGRFVKNSLHHILNMAFGEKKLFLLHRLDKVTSGVLIHTWNADLAKKYQEVMKSGEVSKCYLGMLVTL